MKYLILAIFVPVTSFAQWTTSGSNIYNSNSGVVGIGTTSPTDKLTVGGTLGLFGSGLNGTTYQRFVTYADTQNGLLMEAPLDPNGNKFNIQFNWRGGGTSPFFIQGSTGYVSLGSATPRGQFDVAGAGNIYLANNTITGSGQSLFLPGDVYLAPYTGTDWSYLQARRSDNSGSTNLMLRTWNAGSMVEAMTIKSDGKVGIGTTIPDYKLTVQDGGIHSHYLTGGDYPDFKSSYVSSSSVQGVRAEAISYYANKYAWGVLGIATSSNSAANTATAIGVYGEANDPTGDGWAGWFNGNLAYSGNLWHVSDRNLKENIKEMPTSLDLLMKIQPKQYSYKKIEGLHFPEGDQAGFIAQDIQKLLPNLVSQKGLPLPSRTSESDSINTKSSSEKYLTLDYIGLIPYIIKSIQEQQEIIEKQNALIESILLKDSASSTTLLGKDVPHIVKLYPNPAENQLDLECFTNGQIATIYIYNKEGKVYKNFTMEAASTTISLEFFENGVYVVALFVNGAAFDSKRLIVSK